MKLLLVVLFAFAATSAFQFQKRQTACTVPTSPITNLCVDLNGDCWTGVLNNETTTCRSGLYCTSNTITVGTCQNIIGGDCTEFPGGVGACTDARKTRYATCNNATDICEVDTAVSVANDDCTDDADCVGTMPCTSGLCVGHALDAPCDPTLDGDDCAYGLWCSGVNNTCRPQRTIGASCNSPSECPVGAECPIGHDICTDRFEGTNGQTCGNLGSFGCRPGLTCISNVCEPEITTMDFCDGFSSPNCTAPQSCNCVDDQFRCEGGVEGINQACYDATVAYRTCLRDNQCRNFDTPLRSESGKASCGYRMCEYEFACTVTCSATACGSSSDAGLINLCLTASDTGPSTDGNSGNTQAVGKAYSMPNWLM